MTGRLFGIADVLDADHWYTPPWVFDGLGIVFDLDVAAPVEPLEWIPAKRSYTVADDGLVLPWEGTIWCNPPYSEPAPWCYRWAEHADGCILLRSDLSTRGPFAATSVASSLYVPPKRIQFVNGHGGPTGAANFSTVLLGAGTAADAGIVRLAERYGGTARRLLVPKVAA
jgi:hypothetical protein